jgi:integrase
MHLLPASGKLKREKKHHAAVPYREVPAVVAEIRKLGSTSANALLFTILTAARTGETLGAIWDEIDLVAKLWTISAARMKAAAEHRVPLLEEVITLLKSLPRDDTNPHLFRGPRAKNPLQHGHASVSAWPPRRWRHRPRLPRVILDMGTRANRLRP